MMAEQTGTAIQLSQELLEKLHAYANALDLSVSWLINRAVGIYVRSLPPVENCVLEINEVSPQGKLPLDTPRQTGETIVLGKALDYWLMEETQKQ